jgi:hypothetical protein
MWSYDIKQKKEKDKTAAIEVAYRETDRRTKAIELAKYYKNKLEEVYPPMIAKEYLSALFRQRGIPSLDIYTKMTVNAFRVGFGVGGECEGVIRKILVVDTWRSSSATVTMWTLEPVLSTALIRGNSLNAAAAKENFDRFLVPIEPLSMSSDNTTVINNEIKGRWAGWLVSQQLEAMGEGNPVCMNVNMSGSNLFFAIHYEGMNVIHMMMTPESIGVLASYAPVVCAKMKMTSSMLRYSSTKLKIQPPVHTSRASSLSIYGNGSMQVCGSPNDIEMLCACLREIIRTIMDTEMIAFLKTMRRADVHEF